jgi:hypothetical protein
MAFTVYDSDSVVLIICAVPITDGRAESEFVKIKPVKDAYTVKTGADGAVTRSATNSKVYDWSVKLLKSSPHNAQLAALHAIDRSDKNGAGVGVFLLETGSIAILGQHCWIKVAPEYSLGSECDEVTWEGQFEAEHALVIPGGVG